MYNSYMNTEYDSILEIANAFDYVGHNLYIGGTISDYSQFSSVVCCTPEVICHNRTEQITHMVPFNDTNALPPERFIQHIVDLVLNDLNHGSVYVHCSAGINRSAMIVALVLVRLGRTPIEAVEHLRTTRSCSVLCNETFYNRVMQG